ncbi:hypothetical protein B0H16DRAFT_1695538 [Mycena metata]|uniref:Uncharacterized protein n=1 Tax=Mycena metata TaxID=1033252 RepID=A0AAD7I7H4_9AGAR|nr:hypothetical protein B0H16DRAFT_1695538 [Mycena metata]
MLEPFKQTTTIFHEHPHRSRGSPVLFEGSLPFTNRLIFQERHPSRITASVPMPLHPYRSSPRRAHWSSAPQYAAVPEPPKLRPINHAWTEAACPLFYLLYSFQRIVRDIGVRCVFSLRDLSAGGGANHKGRLAGGPWPCVFRGERGEGDGASKGPSTSNVYRRVLAPISAPQPDVGASEEPAGALSQYKPQPNPENALGRVMAVGALAVRAAICAQHFFKRDLIPKAQYKDWPMEIDSAWSSSVFDTNSIYSRPLLLIFASREACDEPIASGTMPLISFLKFKGSGNILNYHLMQAG